MSTEDYKGFTRFRVQFSQYAASIFTRMWVFLVVFLLTFFVFIGTVSEKNQLNNTAVYALAQLLVSVGKSDLSLHYRVNSTRQSFRAGQVNQLKYLRQGMQSITSLAVYAAAFSVILASSVMLFFIRFFRTSHQQNKTKKIRLRGAILVPVAELNNAINQSALGSPYPLGNVKWLADKVPRHLYLSGDTGVGKTQALMAILTVIRERQEKAILLDKNGELLSHFYCPETDYVLGPFDERCENWTPFHEGLEEMDFERLARSFIPSFGMGNKDEHWPEAAVTVFSALLYQVAKQDEFDGSIDHLLTALLRTTRSIETDLLGQQKEVVKRDILTLIEGTLASLVIDPESPEHASSVIASLVPKIRALRYLRGLENKPPFSLRNWVKNDSDKGWIFIRVSEDQMDAAGSLVAAWFDTVIKAALSLNKSDSRVIWSVIDELQSLGKINALKKALSEGRKHGLRNILGFTSVNELFDIYGENSATAMLAQCNSKMVFQTDEPKAARWNAELLGMEEVVTENESLNYGKYDSLGVNDQRTDKFIVMPSEIQRLPHLRAYLKFSGDWPVAQVETVYTERAVIAEPFVPRCVPPPLTVTQTVIPLGESISNKKPSQRTKDRSDTRSIEPLI